MLVHGLWGNSEDWRWVRSLLEDAEVWVIAPDLPSHSTPTAGLAEDAAEVHDAIRACAPPVAAVGWSYGGRVMSLAAAGEGSVSRLIYISDIPRPAGFPGEDLGWIGADPHVLVHPDGRFVLDNDLWLKDDGGTFSEEVRRHFRDHPRRLVTRATHGAQPVAAWETTPTTVLIGGRDNMLSEVDRKWVEEHIDDVHRPLHHLPASGGCRPASPGGARAHGLMCHGDRAVIAQRGTFVSRRVSGRPEVERTLRFQKS